MIIFRYCWPFESFSQVFAQVKEWHILKQHEMIRLSHLVACSILFNLLSHQTSVFQGCVRYFSFSHQITALQKLLKMLFISPKKLFSFSRYPNLCITVLPSFSDCWLLLQGMIKDKWHVYDIINCLNRNCLHILFEILRRKKLCQ